MCAKSAAKVEPAFSTAAIKLTRDRADTALLKRNAPAQTELTLSLERPVFIQRALPGGQAAMWGDHTGYQR